MLQGSRLLHLYGCYTEAGYSTCTDATGKQATPPVWMLHGEHLFSDLFLYLPLFHLCCPHTAAWMEVGSDSSVHYRLSLPCLRFLPTQILRPLSSQAARRPLLHR
ncbi:hypothetical protein GDO81_006296 [Engystomops pustulosus]|uniref:Uncharacterized protein n=1 Tax=Engystomops pustulosus TaxID=76066 RepID=A0AAV7CVM6_ENGPU|nr:hypothetical protein GDO81_006296 [Engystomops pustulosus]